MTKTTEGWTQATAETAAAELRVAGLDGWVSWHQAIGSDGKSVVRRYVVAAKLADGKTGNVVVREFRGPSEMASAAQIATEMKKELRARAAETRARIRAERDAR